MKFFKVITSIVAISSCMAVGAQSYNDIVRYGQPQFNGTARATAMGGAFSSLGGDFSALSLNPAGIATYRSNEFSFTPAIISSPTNSHINGDVVGVSGTTNDNATTFTFNQIGFVGTYRPMREVTKGIVSTHFGIGYNRNNNFNYRSMATAYAVGNSMTDMILTNVDGLNENNWNKDYPIDWDEYSPYSGLAWGSYLLDINNEGYYTSYLGIDDKVDQTRIINKSGYSGEFNITLGANISNKILIGGSINFATIDYSYSSTYFEQFNTSVTTPDPGTFENFEVNNYIDATGKGINIKVGAIFKPIEDLRIGLSYHSPTWYNMRENYGYSIAPLFFNDIFNEDGDNIGKNHYSGIDLKYDYQLNSPDKIIAGLSYIIGKKAILSFDYERVNYSGSKFKSNYDILDDINFIVIQNNNIKTYLTSTNNFRFGTEIKVNDYFSIRGGYDLINSPYKETSTESKIKSISTGFGYRVKNYFIDATYKVSSFEESYFTYEFNKNPEKDYIIPPTVKSETKDHNFILTMGWKF